MPLDVRKRSALPVRLLMNSGLRPNKSGRSPRSKWRLTGRPKAFRTSGGIAEDFLGKAAAWQSQIVFDVTLGGGPQRLRRCPVTYAARRETSLRLNSISAQKKS